VKEAWEHRGVPYSLNQEGDDKWVWKLHPYLVANGMSSVRPIISGEVSGTLEDAKVAAEAAIDRELAKSNP
jgi:hypothetical protein